MTGKMGMRPRKVFPLAPEPIKNTDGKVVKKATVVANVKRKNIYYSQNGEDYILSQLFRNKRGVFVEIGCIDGLRFSNTLYLANRGWTGVCVEAHADYIPLLRKNRPESKVVHAAVGDQDLKTVNFYANSRGSLSTLNKNDEEYFKSAYGKYFTGFKVQKVPLRKLDTILKKTGTANIDLISIDVEGQEEGVLKGFNLKEWAPKVLVVECDSLKNEQIIDSYVLKYGYRKYFKLEQNVFYLNNAFSKELDCLSIRDVKITLCHTEHPLDNNGDIIRDIWMRPQILRSIKAD